MTRTLLLLALLLTAACSAAETPATPEGPAAAWSAAGLEDYRFDFDRTCFCLPPAVEPVTIEVRQGAIASVTSRRTGQPVEPAEGIEWYTIDELIGLIREAEASGQQVRVEYAPEGYPTEIEIGQIAADAGVIYTIANVRPL